MIAQRVQLSFHLLDMGGVLAILNDVLPSCPQAQRDLALVCLDALQRLDIAGLQCGEAVLQIVHLSLQLSKQRTHSGFGGRLVVRDPHPRQHEMRLGIEFGRFGRH
ncbi:Uncharacterised protein [Starkeya nomas]|uniref:Uncharacterized protein n=1 Tax=Starkeya nomas TaxID=2666134 RepID=A0A5S9NC67_9HYPH|nr:Uncharacterised protein [Starkeya nomas]